MIETSRRLVTDLNTSIVTGKLQLPTHDLQHQYAVDTIEQFNHYYHEFKAGSFHAGRLCLQYFQKLRNVRLIDYEDSSS